MHVVSQSVATVVVCPKVSILLLLFANGIARTLKKLNTSKEDYWIRQWFSSIASLFKIGISPKGKNLLPEGANSFL